MEGYPSGVTQANHTLGSPWAATTRAKAAVFRSIASSGEFFSPWAASANPLKALLPRH
jgi:hypothetical protein